MNVNYNQAVIIVGIEFSLILLVVVFSVFLKLITYIKHHSQEKLVKAAELRLIRLIHKKDEYPVDRLPNKLKNLEILIPILLKYDEIYPSGYWQELRAEIIRKTLIPLARKSALKNTIISNVLAAEAYCYILDHNSLDEELILKLVNSETPFVYLNGVRAALAYGSEKTIKASILQYAHQPWLAQSANLKIFKLEHPGIHSIVVQILQKSKEDNVRAVCYNILTQLPPQKISMDVISDCYSDNLNLKLSALKFIAYVDKSVAVDILIKELLDKHWITRLTAVDKLSDINARQAIPNIRAMLGDEEWWVRLRAAKALKTFGVEGDYILEAINVDPDQVIIDNDDLTESWW